MRLCKRGGVSPSNSDNSRTAAAPTQEIGKSPKFENSQLFVSTSIKASQNSTSQNCLDPDTRKNASETNISAIILKNEERSAGLKLDEDTKSEDESSFDIYKQQGKH